MKKTTFILLTFAAMLILTNCQFIKEPDFDPNSKTKPKPEPNPNTNNNVLMLKVDYTTNTFEGGYEFTFPQETETFNISYIYNPPGDFGDITLFYQELDEKLFAGGIVWMGCGRITYPELEQWLPAEAFEITELKNLIYPKNGFESITEFPLDGFGYDYSQAWVAVQSLVKVREYLNNNPEQKVKIYFYRPSVGIGNPPDWKWIIFLKNDAETSKPEPEPEPVEGQITGYIVGYEICDLKIENGLGRAQAYIVISENLKDTLAVFNLPADIYDFPAEIFTENRLWMLNAAFPEQYRYSFKILLEYTKSSEKEIYNLGFRQCAVPALAGIAAYRNCVPALAVSAKKIEADKSFPKSIASTLIAQGELFGSGQEGIIKQNLVIKTQTEWNNLITAMNSVNNVSRNFAETDVDFSKYQIIAAFDDVKGCGGYSISITQIEEHAERIVVTVNQYSPQGACPTVMTQPYHIVKIPVSDKQIVFQ